MTLNNKNTYYIYGKHAVTAALENNKRKKLELLVSESLSKDNKVSQLASSKGVAYRVVGIQELNKLFPNQIHQGIALKVGAFAKLNLKDFLASTNKKDKYSIIILDQINDPHNLGAVMRSAAAFEADAVIIPKDSSVSENASVAKASCGGLELVPLIEVTNISQSIELLKEHGFWIAGLDASEEKDLNKLVEYKKLALVFGSEGEGLRRLTKEKCDFLVSIPISKQMESLNISNAVAITLYAISFNQK